MNRIDIKLMDLKKEGRKMLSPYVTAGDPSLKMTLKLMHAMVAKGADILEIGMPFSDPMAEGPVIQAAMERGLEQGVFIEEVLALIHQFRENDKLTPIILMGYLNPIEVYGYEKFAKKAKDVGVDGTIIVDLPPEESDVIASIWKKEKLASIYLCSPTTSDARMARIEQYAQSYLYFVSLKGVSGSNAINLTTVKEKYAHLKQLTTLPIMVGFGIKTSEMAAKVAQFADGIIVGAALIERLTNAEPSQIETIAGQFIGELRQALDHGINYE